jgi:hypothetical protein
MSKTRMFFYLLIIFGAYGLVGRIDYEEAVRTENAYRDAPPTRLARTFTSDVQPEQVGRSSVAAVAPEWFADPCGTPRH